MMEQLADNKTALFFSEPHSKWVWMGKKSLIILDKNHEQMVDKSLYLVDKNYVYGSIRLHPANKINKELFTQRHNIHLVSNDDAKNWWGDKEEFYEYSYEWIRRFEEPLRWKYKDPVDHFIENMEFAEQPKTLEEKMAEEFEEGKEMPLDNLSLRMQANLNKIAEKKVWMPFVAQLHSKGKINHIDLRLFVPNKDYGKILSYSRANALYENKRLNGILEGFCLYCKELSDKELSHNKLRMSFKNPQPVDWLWFSGITNLKEAQTEFPGAITIIARGIYTVNNLNDKKLQIQFRCDKGNTDVKHLSQSSIANLVDTEVPMKLMTISGTYVIGIDNTNTTFTKILNDIPNSEVTNEQIEQIVNLRNTYSLTQLSELTEISKSTVGLYLKTFNK